MPMVIGGGSVTGLTSGGLPAGSVTTNNLADASITTAKINDSAVTTAKLNDSSVTQPKIGYTGAILQCVRGYDDTTSTTGGGSAPNTVYFTAYYITLLRASSTILVQGIFNAQTNDDSSVIIQYNINGGSWVGPTSLMNSQVQTYSGLGDLAWAHKSNDAPFPFPVHNFVSAASIGATAGTVVGFRMGVINETATTYTYYNRSLGGQDNTVNFATSRSFMTLWELAP